MASKELSLFHLGSVICTWKKAYLVVERREKKTFCFSSSNKNNPEMDADCLIYELIMVP